jgi:membrane AbrB-like protein
MTKLNYIKIVESYLIASIGGAIFFIANFPLPWVLGPMAVMIIWKSSTKREMVCPSALYNIGLVTLGIYFGLSFTKSTFITVTPFIIPFLIATALLITISVVNSILITKFIKVDSITSVFGSIPGGLSEMVAASNALKANTSMVIVFQTVRLLTVVFLVPLIVVHVFTAQTPIINNVITQLPNHTEVSDFGWYLLAFVGGWIFRNKIPASFVIVPLLITAILNVLEVELPIIPNGVLIAAQITVGMFMGTRITLNDLKLGGKYSGIYFIMTLILVALSFGVGYLFSITTNLSLATSILSFSPGGLVEMVLTAQSVGADPAIVSSLQFLRVLFIIMFVPSMLKWYFKKKSEKVMQDKEHTGKN